LQTVIFHRLLESVLPEYVHYQAISTFSTLQYCVVLCFVPVQFHPPPKENKKQNSTGTKHKLVKSTHITVPKIA
jgi:hypothetical protein